jgi:Tol biopolymer transport system component
VVSGEPRVPSGEATGVKNVFVRENTSASYQLVNLTPPGVKPANAERLATTRDSRHVVFREAAKLTGNAPEGAATVYEWSEGAVRLVTLLRDGTPVAGSFAGLSPDGSRVFFTYAGNLYARVDGTSTVQVDASQAGGSGGGGRFLAASPDGSRVTFSADASAALTADTTPGSASNLYSYDFASGRLAHLDASQAGGPGGGGSFIALSGDGSHALFSDDASAALTGGTVSGSGQNLYSYDLSSGRVTDLTPGEHAEVLGLFGVGEDGSYVYFEAEGALASGATRGQRNRYVWRAGTTTFLAALANLSLGGLTGQAAPKVSKDGRFLAFASPQSLTGYDNTAAGTGKPDREIYLYDAAANSLVCASCNPSGAAPTGGPRWGTGTSLNPRNLSEDGRVFFDTPEALLPADTNGKRDVYEFEPSGVGSCSDPGGCVSLISTGTGSQDTWFIEASPSGDDVFLREYQKLVPADKQEEARTIYDARVNGGLPEPVPPPACTTADACRTAPAPQPSIFGAPASQTSSGAGNLLVSAPPVVKSRVKPRKCKRGYVKNKKHKCVKAKKARKAKRAGTTNREGSR